MMKRRPHVIRISLLLGLLCLSYWARAESSPWDMARLSVPPAATWGERKGLVQEVYYAGEPFQGKATHVFAYYARPEGKGPFPGMVLVHGGGGKAFSSWAVHWAERGYAAIAMDLSGNGPSGRLQDGGPDQSDTTKFRPFEEQDAWRSLLPSVLIRSWQPSRRSIVSESASLESVGVAT